MASNTFTPISTRSGVIALPMQGDTIFVPVLDGITREKHHFTADELREVADAMDTRAASWED